jgi:hypothetical protein
MDFLVDGGRRHLQKENRYFYRGVRLAGLKPRRSFSYTIITKNSFFDCAVALGTMQNAFSVSKPDLISTSAMLGNYVGIVSASELK